MAKTPKQSLITKKTLIRLERERAQRRWLIIGTIVVGILVVGVILYGLIDQYVLVPSKPVAKVGAETITIKDFQWRVRYARMQMIQQYFNNYQMAVFYANDENLTQYFQSILAQTEKQLSDDETQVLLLGSQVLDTMIEEKIIEQEAKKLGITVSDEEVETDLQIAFGYFAHGTPTPLAIPTNAPTSTYSPTQLALVTPLPTESILEETEPLGTQEPTTVSDLSELSPQDISTPTATLTPAPTATEITYEGYQKLKDDLIKNMAKINLTEDRLRYQLYIRNLKDKLIKEITKDVKPEAEMVWARHILVADLETANTVLERLKAGEDFSALADEFSNDSSNNTIGGDTGWFTVGQKDAEYEKVAFNLAIGQISEPIQTVQGFYIIQVLGHEVRPLSYSQYEQLKSTKFNEWLQSKVQSDMVVRYDRWEKVIPTDPTLQEFFQQQQ